MEKKTNKEKLEIFKFFEKISFITRLQPMLKLEVIMPIRVLLHAEFISAMKTDQNPTIFMKKAKKEKKIEK